MVLDDGVAFVYVSHMATIRVDDDTLAAVTDYALHLSVALGRRVSLNEALKALLPPAATDGQEAATR